MATSRKTGKAVGRRVTKTVANGRQTLAQATKDQFGHLVGSRKGEVHKTYAERGAGAAEALGLKLKLKPSTLKSWIGTWRRSGPKKPASKKAAKRTSKAKATNAAA